MEEKKAKELLNRYRDGTCSDEEKAWIEQRFNEYIRFSEELPSAEAWAALEKELRPPVFHRLPLAKPGQRWYWLSAAATLALALGVTTWLWKFSTSEAGSNDSIAIQQDVDPGGERAVLTLADGRKVYLDEIQNGEFYTDQTTHISKSTDGKLVYAGTADTGAGPQPVNTIETPKGGQYHVVLPDGTLVSLNSASSLSYPIRFTGGQRRVVLSGEAYFEVQEQHRNDGTSTRIPFIVESAGQLVEVLGTHFNVNAYPDEPTVKTTLIEGSVRVSTTSGTNPHLLKPSEQSAFNRDGAFTVQQVDPEVFTAWTQNVFSFYRVDLSTIIRQIERWYDVEFDQSAIPAGIKLYGEIGRDKKLSAVLAALAANTGLTFQLSGRRVAVTN